MNFEELLSLRAKIDSAIAARIERERKHLTDSLERLNSIASQATGAGRGQGGRTLAPKYYNPANPSETWAGRGLKPRWLVAALKGGKHKLSDFEIRHKD